MRPIARYTSVFAFVILAVAVLVTGCAQQSEDSPSSDTSRSQEAIAERGPPGRTASETPVGTTSEKAVIAANVVFSSPGRYESANGELFVEIKRQSSGHVTYHPRHEKGPGIGPTSPLSENELIMCWDGQGRLWTYHPIEFVHYHYAKERALMRVFVGTGGKVRDEMPVAFAESLPEDIEEMAEKAMVDGVWQLPQPQKPISEQRDAGEPG